MTKAEIVEKVAAEIKISKVAAARALAVITDSITQTIKAGGKATLIGFGTFSRCREEGQKGKEPSDRQRDQDRCKEGPQIFRGSSIKSSSKWQGSPSETQSKESASQKNSKTEEEIKPQYQAGHSARFLFSSHW